MILRFWGVRADLAIPSASTLRFGGNTICATVTCGENQLCILDAGFGMTFLGRTLMAVEFGQGKGNALILISHNNWDHTQGIGFFGPFFKKGNRFTFYGLGSEEFNFYDRLETQLYPALSPLQTLNHLEAQLSFRESSRRAFQWGAIQVQSALMPPGADYAGGYQPLAYRLTEAGRSLVYITEAEYPDGHLPEKFVDFCRGADLLIHDAYFSVEDYRPGWGHSPVTLAVELAHKASIPRLILYHYNPTYNDDRIDEMVSNCQDRSDLQVMGAREGLEISI